MILVIWISRNAPSVKLEVGGVGFLNFFFGGSPKKIFPLCYQNEMQKDKSEKILI